MSDSASCDVRDRALNSFCQCRMDMDSFADNRVRCTRIHQGDVNMNELRCVHRQSRRTQDQVASRIDDDLDHTCGLTDLEGLAAVAHLEPADFDIASGAPRLVLGHSYTAQLRIRENSIRYHAFRCAGAVASNLREQDAIVIPGGMGE